MDNVNKILERGVEEVINKENLKKRLKSGEKLRVKLGIDPTAKDLHLGHTVVLRKLKQFQEAGHTAVLIVGDFTATIGDPSGRNDLRPKLSKEDIKKNMAGYLKEAGKVLDIKKTEIRYNSEWYKNKKADFLSELTSKFTVARVLERDDFQRRIKEDRDISLLEILYPVFQGYDSVEVKADVELGGTDQKFNLLMGRKVQKKYSLPEQDIITMTLIEGLDGVRKMSKSLGNYIGISEEPNQMFSKIMSIPDDLMVKYFTLLTDIDEEEIEQLRKDRLNPNMAKLSPKGWKEKLALEITAIYNGPEKAQEAKGEFQRVFSEGQLPEEIKEVASGQGILQTMVMAELVPSKSEAKRLVDQGAVEINGKTIESWDFEPKKGDVIKVGKRKFLKII